MTALTELANQVERGEFAELSWQRLMLGEALDTLGASTTRAFLVVKPVLDFSRLFPAEQTIARIRTLADALDLDPAHGVQVRLTGDVALAQEELMTVSRGAGWSALAALVLVTVVLVWGLRSARLIVASLVTLLVGLSWTAAFAAIAVGSLNMISVAFAVLYIGLGIDYAIHFCLRYRAIVESAPTRADSDRRFTAAALERTAEETGTSLVLCAFTTGAGFLAFVPTSFAGIAELGVIGAGGMLVNLVASLSLLPALLALMPMANQSHAHKNFAAQSRTDLSAAQGGLGRVAGVGTARGLLAGVALLAVLSVFLIPKSRFDDNPLNLQNPDGEAVATFRSLLADERTAPWSLAVIAEDAEHARALAASLRNLPLVREATTILDFVPGEQSEKLLVIDELSLVLGVGAFGSESPEAGPVSADPGAGLVRLRGAVTSMVTGTDSGNTASSTNTELPTREAAAALAAALGRLVSSKAPGDRAARFEQAALSGLPAQLRILDLALSAGPVALEDLPASLRERWIAADGRYLVEVSPVQNLDDTRSRNEFVAAVSARVPGATGVPLVYVESGRAVVGAFRQALTTALVIVLVLLVVLIRRPADVALVAIPLFASALLTVGAMVVLNIPFNFANVITLPLMLGVGVDHGIHLVRRMRAEPEAGFALLRSDTGRAIGFSTLTTVCSFGNLMLSPHPGTASMGAVLTLGMGLLMLVTFAVIPAAAHLRAARIDGERPR